MAKITLSADFKEFLSLLDSHEVEYLVVGGYAVAFYGYPRATGDLDVWVGTGEDTAGRLTEVLKAFGFDTPETTPELFLNDKVVVRMGMPPFRIDITNFIHGVEFAACYRRGTAVELDGVPVRIIALDDLKVNKAAAARPKDLDDLENLP